MFVKEAEDLRECSLDEIEERIVSFAAEIYARTCAWLRLVAEFDRREAYHDWGMSTCSSWLAWRCGMAERAAREHVRVARALRELPEIDAAFARGELSFSKVRALTRVAEPDDQAELLELARHATASQLERVLRAYCGALDPDDARRIHRDRFFNWSLEPDGSVSFRGRLPAEEATVLIRAIESRRDELRADSWAEEGRGSGSAEPVPPESPAKQAISNADAAVAVAEASLAAPDASSTGGDRNQLVVHIDPEVLCGSQQARCASDDGAPLAAETARRIACDCGIVPVVEKDGEVLSVGRKMRTIPASIGRALRARDDGCRFPGCNNRRFVDRHHIEPWAEGGETSLENLCELCRRHHRAVHEGGFTVTRLSDDLLEFRRPDGTLILDSPPIRLGTSPRTPEPEPPELSRLASIAGQPRYERSMDADHVLFALLTTPGARKRLERDGPFQ